MPKRTQFIVLKLTYWYKNWYEILSPPKGKVGSSNLPWDTILFNALSVYLPSS